MGDWEALAEEQLGVLSRSQALGHGLTRRRLQRLLTQGTLERIYPSVYRLAAIPRQFPWALVAARLWSGNKAVISHQAAAALWGLEDFSKDVVELSGTRALAPPPALTYHHVRRLPRADLSKTKGLWATSVERTLLDLVGAISPTGVTERQVERAFGEALRRKMTETRLLRWCLERNRRRGRTGCELFAELLRIREAYGVTDSPLESDFGHLIRRAGLLEPVRGYTVIESNHFLAKVDFAWPEKKLCVQVHGSSVHRQQTTWEKDQQVENTLQAHRWTVLKVTHRMLTQSEASLAALLRRELSHASPASPLAPSAPSYALTT
jgi:very-short-patch-repair endonuclease